MFVFFTVMLLSAHLFRTETVYKLGCGEDIYDGYEETPHRWAEFQAIGVISRNCAKVLC